MNTPRLRDIATCPTSRADSALPFITLDVIEQGAGRLLPEAELPVVRREDTVTARPGDVLFGKLRPYLQKVVHVEGYAQCSAELLVVRPRPGLLDSRYLYYLMLSKNVLDWSNATSVGVKMPRTDWSALSTLTFGHLPSRTDQRYIAQFLDTECSEIDAVSAEQRQLADLIDERRSAVLDAEIARCLADNSIARGRLKNFARVNVGIVIQPSRWYVTDGGVPALRGLNVKPGVVTHDDLIYISDLGNAENSRTTLAPGDVVVVRTGNAGTAALVPEWAVGGNAIDLLVVRPGPALNPKYLELMLNSRYTQEQVELGSVGALQAHFNTGSLRNLDIVVPSLAHQQALVHRVTLQLDHISELRAQIDITTALLNERKQTLITAAVTGQLEVA